ncbi:MULTISPECIES: radical SAM protein [unclassified Mesorhizobium]|uniref:B12-binding domain-containing radical SAM protein n=2 Tax=Mesorhizobium TaxID=68287 RepID=UPI001675C75A|nr:MULTISPECIES: radical SAM protein [unclassified Mesorhizobium]
MFNVASAASGFAFDFGLSPIRYDVPGFDAARLADLIALQRRPEANAFEEIWTDLLVPQMLAQAPDVVGITITNRQQIVPGLMLASMLRRSGQFVVLGGAVYTKFAAQLQSRPEFFEAFADVVVVYEGETALEGILDARAAGEDLSEIPNLLYLDSGRVKATVTHVENVGLLPTPDFEGLPLSSYLTPVPVLPILTGKGCYFNRCKFCDIPYINHVSRKAYRIRPVEKIAEDVRTLSAWFDARHFVITDEALSPRLLMSLSDALRPESGSFNFTGYARLEDGFNEEACRKVAAMGMRKLFFGLESASQTTVDHMSKGINIAAVPRILRDCRAAALDFHIFSIVGFPEETEEVARQTFNFFMDNAEVIGSAGSSFDIHPFGLELRTPYFEEREAVGAVVPIAALERDFVIGLRPEEWRNVRGISPDRVAHLIDEDFLPALRRRYRDYHARRSPLFPSTEEYSVLYGEHYAGRAFPYRTSVPLEETARFSFHWNKSWPLFRTEAGDYRAVATNFEIPIDSRLFELITIPHERTWGECLTIDAGVRSPDVLRSVLDFLIEIGLIFVMLADEAPTAEVFYQPNITRNLGAAQ